MQSFEENGSEPEVPNHALTSVGGRPPVASDETLLKLATQLNDQLGRPPTAFELIDAAGGCQKKRALNAIAELKLGIAQAAVHSELVFPRGIEMSLRGLMGQWLNHAAAQLASRHQVEAERVEVALERSQAVNDEQFVVINQLREAMADRDRTSGELLSRVNDLSGKLARVLEEKIRLESVCDERQRLLDSIAIGSHRDRGTT